MTSRVDGVAIASAAANLEQRSRVSSSPFRVLSYSFDEQPPVSYNASFASTPRNHGFDPNNRVEVMERVLFHLHARICNVSLAWTSTRTRKLLEHVLLVAAICCFGALILLHRNFVVKSSFGGSNNIGNGTSICLHDLPGGFNASAADITHLVVLPQPESSNGYSNLYQHSQVIWKRRQRDCGDSCFWEDETDTAMLSWISQQEKDGTLPLYYSYSTTKGYLMLPPEHRFVKEHLNIQYVLISPTDSTCFGEPFLQFLIWKCFIGPDTILLNWIQSFHYESNVATATTSITEKEGYIYNLRTKRLWELPGSEGGEDQQRSTDTLKWWHRLPTLMSKLGILVKTAFLFFFCTTLVSFTLRETQERMLDFTKELSRRVQQSLPVSDLIATHLIQNLVFVPIMVGMMFFLIEFYGGDKFLAFSISSIVWSVESFSVISLRSTQGLLYFPKFFFLLFLLFHVYQVAFRETGFVYTALTVVWCFMFHSMVFFWHRFELPAVALGHVTVDRPRMTTSRIIFDSNDSQLQHPGQQPYGFSSPTRFSHPADSTQATPRVGNFPPNHNVTLPLPRTIMPTRSVSSASSTGAGGAGVATNNVASHPSFSTTTSSRNLGLFRHNHDDDNSTGSMLYFMGGEVVVHRGIPTSSENEVTPPAMMSREESNFSLPSAASDPVGVYGYVGHTVGLDVSESRRSYEDDDDLDADEFANVPNSSSMDTVPSSNVKPHPLKEKNDERHPHDSNGTPMDHYAQESGGLQAILESRLTPRHSNSHHDNEHLHDASGIMIDAGNRLNGTTQQNQAYQRTPPTFPGLPSSNGKEERLFP